MPSQEKISITPKSNPSPGRPPPRPWPPHMDSLPLEIRVRCSHAGGHTGLADTSSPRAAVCVPESEPHATPPGPVRACPAPGEPWRPLCTTAACHPHAHPRRRAWGGDPHIHAQPHPKHQRQPMSSPHHIQGLTQATELHSGTAAGQLLSWPLDTARCRLTIPLKPGLRLLLPQGPLQSARRWENEEGQALARYPALTQLGLRPPSGPGRSPTGLGPTPPLAWGPRVPEMPGPQGHSGALGGGALTFGRTSW